MRRKLAALFLACLPAFAVGTVQQSFQQLGQTTTFVLAVNWVGDSVTGTVPATPANLGGLVIQGYRIFSVEVAPGTPAPSSNYSLTLTTFLGTDALAGAGSSLSATLPTTLQAPSTAAPVNGVLTINIAGNSVASAQGRFLVYFTPVFQVMGLPSVNAGGNNTFTGANLFSGNNTFTGTNAFSGPLANTGTDSGTQTISGVKTWTAQDTFTNTTFVNAPLYLNCASGGSVGASLCIAGTNATTGGIDIFNGQLGVTANERFAVVPATGNVTVNNLHVQGISGGALSGTDALAVSSAGLVTTYNTTATQGQGVTWVPCVTSQRTETAADANLLTCAIPAVAGSYRVRFVLSVSAANAATLGWTLTWRDSNNGVNANLAMPLFQQNTGVPALTFTTSTAVNYWGYADIDVNNAAVSIVVALTFSGTSFTGKASATVERII